MPVNLTICIPAYKPSDLMAATLESVQAQTYRSLQIVISNDGGFNRAALTPFERDPKITIVHQPTRLGWAGNTNWLIDRVGTPFFAILPHDDRPAPEFYEVMMDLLRSNPRAQAAYSAMEVTTPAGEFMASSPAFDVTGDLETRIEQVIANVFVGLSFRAVNRTPASLATLSLPRNPPDDLFADSTWTLRQAVLGELVSTAQPLYRKVHHDSNTHIGWRDRPAATIANAWVTHCAQLAAIAGQPFAAPGMKERFQALARDRLGSPKTHVRPAWIKAAVEATWRDENDSSLNRFFDQQLARYEHWTAEQASPGNQSLGSTI